MILLRPWTVGLEGLRRRSLASRRRHRSVRCRRRSSRRRVRRGRGRRHGARRVAPRRRAGPRRPGGRELAAGSLSFTPTGRRRCATRRWSGSPTTRPSTRTIAPTRVRRATGPSTRRAADPNAVILVSSQLPVGTTRLLEQSSHRGAGSRARPRTCGSAPRSRRSRIPTGSSSGYVPTATAPGSRSCSVPSPRIEWMGVESAELVKHGLNAFLALSVAFANELATIAEHVGADAAEVERGLKTETPDRAAGLPPAGCRIRRGDAGARHRLPDEDRRARARADASPVRGPREQRRAQALGPEDGRGARRHERRAERPRDRDLGTRLQAGDGHPAPVERGRAPPRARRAPARP